VTNSLVASNPTLINPARVSALTRKYVVRFASLALAYDRDRNHLVAGCQIYLAESTLCIPIDHRLIHSVACRSNGACVSC
jgi:hypothetical protein